jgi:hypothetical protein
MPIYQAEDGTFIVADQMAHQFAHLHLSAGQAGEEMLSPAQSGADSTEDSESSDSAIAGGETTAH